MKTVVNWWRQRGVRRLDIAWVTPQLAVGAAPTRQRLGDLRHAGVTHLVDLRTDGERERGWDAAAAAQQLAVLRVPVIDRHAPEPAQIADAAGWVIEAIAREQPVLLCCRAGAGRSAMLATAVLLALGYDLPAAFGLVNRARRCANPTDAQLDLLRALARPGDRRAPDQSG